jgi:cellulose synthase/poly-beta-1,6-N-acetylglucosamine synthase-like glycosyltransferase
MILRLLAISNQTLLYYYLLCNFSYLLMLIIAFRTSIAHHRNLQSFKLAWIKEAPLAPPISIIVPAHNEEKSICISIQSLLTLQTELFPLSASAFG